MYHVRVPLKILRYLYRDMTFVSYCETEHRNALGNLSTYVTVTGNHDMYGLTTVVQALSRADVITEDEIEFFGDSWVDDNGELFDLDSVLDEPAKTVEDWAALTVLGAAALEVALTKATEAGAIQPMVRCATLPARDHSGSPYEGHATMGCHNEATEDY